MEAFFSGSHSFRFVDERDAVKVRVPGDAASGRQGDGGQRSSRSEQRRRLDACWTIHISHCLPNPPFTLLHAESCLTSAAPAAVELNLAPSPAPPALALALFTPAFVCLAKLRVATLPSIVDLNLSVVPGLL